MSEQVIDRATLEKKDKGELTTIVNALGGKATSRMKKSDLVDLILERSGAVVADASVDDSNDADESSEASDSSGIATPADDQTYARSGEAEVTESGRDGGRSNTDRPSNGRDDDRARSSERSSGESSTPGGRGGRGDNDRSSRGGNQQGEARQGGNHQGGNQQGANAGNPQGGNQQAGSNNGGGQQGGNQQGGNQQGGNQQGAAQQGKGDEPDSGNRRRRRRGRGRDRDEMNEPVVNEPIEVAGILDLRDDGYGFIRVDGLLPSKDDVYVPVKLVRQFGLRRGDLVAGSARPANRNEKNPALAEVDSINGRAADDLGERPCFDRLTPIFPDTMMRLERADEADAVTPRICDLVAPIGKGQRPRGGATEVGQDHPHQGTRSFHRAQHARRRAGRAAHRRAARRRHRHGQPPRTG
ncbi:MAG: hypothetical protein R2710_16675 [Acidimicrobiales bacterium]